VVKIKSKARDFRVRELLDESYLRPRGRFRVYRVTKTKLTSLEAAAALADMAGVAAADVGMAGLKDRQGVTTQYMSVPSRQPVFLKTAALRIEPAGFADRELTSAESSGNAFEVTLRDLSRGARQRLEGEIADVIRHGIPNYFGEQRFGNLRHNQGWIARDLALGEHERALKRLLCSRSANDNEHNRRFKAALAAQWGDWRACRDVAGKFGAHHSIFEWLARHDGDFAGAFRHVASRVRLIHLYAWQSHLWNRCVARYIEEITTAENRIVVHAPEGRLCFARGALAIDPSMENRFRLPGVELADVTQPRQRALYVEALSREGLRPEQFRIDRVSGFQLKGEDRALVIQPARLRIVEVADAAHAGPRPRARSRHALKARSPRAGGGVRLSFDLPRGAYATLLLQRLLPSERGATAADERGPHRARRATANDEREPHRTRAHGPGRRRSFQR
jgi:tRNA pseudouridine13 synthase